MRAFRDSYFNALFSSTPPTHNRCVPLLEECSKGIKTVDSWLDHVRHGRFNSCLGRTKKENHRARLVEQVVEVQSTLSAALSEFREHGRSVVVSFAEAIVD